MANILLKKPALAKIIEIRKNILRAYLTSPHSPKGQSDSKYRYLYPRSKYRGSFTPEKLAFNANLQEFAHKITFICALETSGKISSLQAYKDIKRLWKQLKKSKNNLQIGQDQPE